MKLNSRLSSILIASLTVTVVLAGCTDKNVETDNAPPEGKVDEGYDLGNNGAINGLVVDDNYRPIQLKEDWGNQAPGDFQDLGFVLIRETAQRLETSENGEFQVLDLKPGTYTVTVAADNHEAIERKVNVVAGEFSETTIEARRQFSSGGTTLAQEYTMFVNCALATSGIRLVNNYGCGDLSGDSGRYSFESDLTSIAADVRGVVTEMYAHQEGYFGTSVRWTACDHPEASNNGCVFGRIDQELDQRWGKVVMYPGLQSYGDSTSDFSDEDEYKEEGEDGWCDAADHDTNGCGPSDYFAYNPEIVYDTILFPDHPSKYWQDQVVGAAEPVGCHIDDYVGVLNWDVLTCEPWGNGVVLATKAQYVETVFLYELPEDGIEDYCVLCEDADIPE